MLAKGRQHNAQTDENPDLQQQETSTETPLSQNASSRTYSEATAVPSLYKLDDVETNPNSPKLRTLSNDQTITQDRADSPTLGGSSKFSDAASDMPAYPERTSETPLAEIPSASIQISSPFSSDEIVCEPEDHEELQKVAAREGKKPHLREKYV
jgi:hypothetical protein